MYVFLRGFNNANSLDHLHAMQEVLAKYDDCEIDSHVIRGNLLTVFVLHPKFSQCSASHKAIIVTPLQIFLFFLSS